MTNADARYAVYWVPVHDDPLAEFGRRWTGWCADLGEKHRPMPTPGFDRAGLTRGPSRRGLHGIVCRSFRQKGPIWSLEKALNELADDLQEIAVPGLTLGIAGRRLALVPAHARGQLASLVSRVNAAMAPFRAVPPKLDAEDDGHAEAARAAGLTWVSAETFHLPLTDMLSVGDACALAPRVRSLVAEALIRPFRIADLALVVDPGNSRLMRVEHRYTLSDRSAAVTDAFDCRGPRTLVTATVPLAFAEAG